jgi:hypothetical protein
MQYVSKLVYRVIRKGYFADYSSSDTTSRPRYRTRPRTHPHTQSLSMSMLMYHYVRKRNSYSKHSMIKQLKLPRLVNCGPASIRCRDDIIIIQHSFQFRVVLLRMSSGLSLFNYLREKLCLNIHKDLELYRSLRKLTMANTSGGAGSSENS